MSDNKDERDIDEILASIDAMLAQKDDSPVVTDERKEVVENAARSSEDTLGLSSTNDDSAKDNSSKLHAFEPFDESMLDTSSTESDNTAEAHTAQEETEIADDSEIEKNNTENIEEADIEHTANTEMDATTDADEEPRQRILLTEDFLEPSAQESLPLWAAQASDVQGQENDASSQTASESPVKQGLEESSDNEIDNDDTEYAVEFDAEDSELLEDIPDLSTLDDADVNLDDFDFPDLDIPSANSSAADIATTDDTNTASQAEPAEESSNTDDAEQASPDLDQTFFFEAPETPSPAIDSEAADETKDEDIGTADFESPTEQDSIVQDDEANESELAQTAEDLDDTADETTDEFDAVFEAIANDDTIIFDVSEAMDEDTVYDIEVLDKELVEAFVQDVVREDDAAQLENLDEAASQIDIAEDSTEQTAEEETSASDMQETEVSTEQEAIAEEANLEHSEEELDEGVAPENEATIEDLNLAQGDTQDSEQDEIEHIQEDQAIQEETNEESVVSVESSMASVTSSVTTHVISNIQDEEETLVSLNPDELDPLIEAISDEVRIKLNQHLQQILPELVSEALLEHLSALRDNDND